MGKLFIGPTHELDTMELTSTVTLQTITAPAADLIAVTTDSFPVAEPIYIEKIVEVVKEVPVETIREVVKYVEVEKIVQVFVPQDVPVYVEKVVEKQVEVPVVREKIVEVVKNVPMYIDRIVVKKKIPDYIYMIVGVETVLLLVTLLSKFT